MFNKEDTFIFSDLFFPLRTNQPLLHGLQKTLLLFKICLIRATAAQTYI